MASYPDLPIGTTLRLITPEPKILPADPAHARVNAREPRPVDCGRCAECIGLPEGENHPWTTIRVIAWDELAGQDGELIVQPERWSALSSPRRVHVDDLLELYAIESEGQDAEPGWTTPLAEVS